MNTRISILPKEELAMIRQTILEKISEDQISLSDIGLNNLLIHVAIACKRIRSGKHVSLYSKDVKEIMNHKEYEVARAIVRTLEQKLHVAFPEKKRPTSPSICLARKGRLWPPFAAVQSKA